MTFDQLVTQIEGTFLHEHGLDLVDPIMEAHVEMCIAWQQMKADAKLGAAVRKELATVTTDGGYSLSRAVRSIGNDIAWFLGPGVASRICDAIAAALEAEQRPECIHAAQEDDDAA